MNGDQLGDYCKVGFHNHTSNYIGKPIPSVPSVLEVRTMFKAFARELK